MQNASEIARKLLQINAIKLNPHNPFIWASGIHSPIYCDNRIALSYPEVRNLIKEGFGQLSKSFGPFDSVAGVATAGISHGALLADLLEKPFIYVRSKAKGHGRQNMIEGEVRPGTKVLVIEDLISTGGSSLKAVAALRAANLEVVGTAAIFTYGFDIAEKAFKNASCPLKTLSNYDILLKEASEIGYIKTDDEEILKSWRKDPENWNPSTINI